MVHASHLYGLLQRPVWGSVPGVLSESVSSVPFLHWLTEPVRPAANLDAPGQIKFWVSSLVGAACYVYAEGRAGMTSNRGIMAFHPKVKKQVFLFD